MAHPDKSQACDKFIADRLAEFAQNPPEEEDHLGQKRPVPAPRHRILAIRKWLNSDERKALLAQEK